MRGVIATGNALDVEALVEQARAIPKMEGSDLVSGVTSTRAFDWPERTRTNSACQSSDGAKRRLKIAAYDFGMKWNIMRRLSAHGCDVRVYPASDSGGRIAGDRSPTACFSATAPAIRRR